MGLRAQSFHGFLGDLGVQGLREQASPCQTHTHRDKHTHSKYTCYRAVKKAINIARRQLGFSAVAAPGVLDSTGCAEKVKARQTSHSSLPADFIIVRSTARPIDGLRSLQS